MPRGARTSKLNYFLSTIIKTPGTLIIPKWAQMGRWIAGPPDGTEAPATLKSKEIVLSIPPTEDGGVSHLSEVTIGLFAQKLLEQYLNLQQH